MEDGEVESKITTASPSKTQHYKQNEFGEMGGNIGGMIDNQNNSISKDFEAQSNEMIPNSKLNQYDSNTDSFQNQQQYQASLTEKKLNNYLQQAKYLMSGNQQQQINITNQETSGRQKKIQKQISPQLAKNSLAEGSTHINTHDMIQTQAQRKSQTSNQNQMNIEEQSHQLLDSNPSQQNLFNPSDDSKDTPSDKGKLKNSFKTQTKRPEKLRALKQDEARKSYSDQKAYLTARQPNTHKKQESQNYKTPSSKDLSLGFNSSKTSEMSRQQAQGRFNSKISKTDSIKKTNKIPPNQIMDRLDNMGLDEDSYDNNNYDNDDGVLRYGDEQQYEQLRVLDYDEDGGQQMDLGHVKAINKRHTSKTEVFSPTSQRTKFGGINHQALKQPPLYPLNSQKVSISKATTSIGIGSGAVATHKKNQSQMQMIQDKVGLQSQGSTRNGNLNKKHLTATTSPQADSRQLNKRLSKGKKPSIGGTVVYNQASSRNNQRKVINAHEIQEDFDEDEDYRNQQHPNFQHQQREQDMLNSVISPSQSSKFQFQPKFFKPTNVPAGNVGRQSQSMEEPMLHFSSIHPLELRKDGVNKNLL
ncbi:UNKNOWN [Stylonychia lemnae]|uniref:Uncharacterized protein n=1 Tax=Stylonychia lemnae TaxID=5949 RepID=A0A078AFD4_STYLE|nr:UNKNOWN [Stylonychia lemnae]|eukprot:CDW80959.1 UNKNOWN [Stylonychia lemnae]